MGNEALAKTVSLDGERTKRMLVDMKDHPFVAVVAHPDGIKVFSKDVTPELIVELQREFEKGLNRGNT